MKSEFDLQLEVSGPYYWLDNPSVFQVSEAKQSGIYLWTVNMDQDDIIYYVGHTGRSFSSRMKEHAKEYPAGMYTIYDPEEFSKGQKRKLWDGMWRSGGELRLRKFVEEETTLLPKIHRLVKLMRLWLIPVACDSRTRWRIEGAIVKYIETQDGLAGNFHESGQVRLRHRNEEPIRISVNSPIPIMGLPASFRA